jgi:hypothetical protein
MTGMIKRALTYVLPALVLVLMGVTKASLALAFARPTVELTIPDNRLSANAPFKIHFSSTRLPGGSALYVQQQAGGAHGWKNVVKLGGSSGTTTVSGRPMGAYEYRITAIRRARVIAVSSAKSLYSYGNVTMTTLCGALQAPCGSGTEEIGATVFAFAAGLNAAGARYPTYETVLSADRTTCRGAFVTFATYTPGRPGEAYLRILQDESGHEPEPNEASTSATKTATDYVSFNGSPWRLEDSSSDGNNDVLNATFSCYTPTGQ